MMMMIFMMYMARMVLTPSSMRMKALTTGCRKPRPVQTLAIARQSSENFLLKVFNQYKFRNNNKF